MYINGKALWMVVDEAEGSVVFGTAAPSRVEAYVQAGTVLGEPPLDTKQIKAMGYKAVKVVELCLQGE